VGATVGVGGGESCYPCGGESRLVHFRVILPNFGTGVVSGLESQLWLVEAGRGVAR
jgi:hypothetical protein